MRLLRTQEVAKRLRPHPASVRRLAAQGVIPHFKVGGWRLFDARVVESLRRERGTRSGKRDLREAPPAADVAAEATP